MTLQAAADLAVAPALTTTSDQVVVAFGVMSHPLHDDGVEGAVELAVSGTVEAGANDLA